MMAVDCCVNNHMLGVQVSIHTPHSSAMVHAGDKPLAIHRVPHTDGRSVATAKRRALFPFVLDLHDEQLITLQQSGLHPSSDMKPDV